MNLNLQNSVVSRQDLRSVITELKSCAAWLAQSQVKSRISTKPAPQPPVISTAADDLIKQWHGKNAVTAKSLEELINSLISFESMAPKMSVTLAAPAPTKLKQELVAWCRHNIDPNVLVDFKFNSTMLGGMVVHYQSHIYDWSFRRRILAQKDKFAEVLRGV